MSPKPIPFRTVMSVLRGFGFQVVSQKGSHIKLVKEIPDKGKRVVIVPKHSEIAAGTLRSTMRQAGVPLGVFEKK